MRLTEFWVFSETEADGDRRHQREQHDPEPGRGRELLGTWGQAGGGQH